VGPSVVKPPPPPRERGGHHLRIRGQPLVPAGSLAYIPRKRQDLDRALPLHWELFRALIRAAAVGIAAFLAIRAFDESNAAASVKATAFGMLAAFVGVHTLEFLWRLVRRTVRRNGATGPLLSHGAVAAVLVAATVDAGRLLLDGESPFDAHAADVGFGVDFGITAALFVWVERAVKDRKRRRATREDDDEESTEAR
jgi:hypothetical protein